MTRTRFTFDVHAALAAMAADMVRSNNIPAGVTRRDLEILANSRYCDACGYIYEAANISDGCPICAEMDELREKSELSYFDGKDDALGELDEVKKDLDDLDELAAELKDSLDDIAAEESVDNDRNLKIKIALAVDTLDEVKTKIGNAICNLDELAG